ncbi:hypothetical protein B0A50_07199 [Salinomyces thailandicus]|uniref:WIBG Mago-binding domain-containing protein n=1 Tax=Salinomyces thailandicus TaxID=706561 RepID=A0A4V6WJN1_9PEZI|nr:hypothetical protein B0A50_07199 [Salinomyces thailandica]
MPPKPASSNSGIRRLPTGDSVIPASTRADGSLRKEIKVKPGYKPPEDVEVYRHHRAAGKGPRVVPGAEKAEKIESSGGRKRGRRKGGNGGAGAHVEREGGEETAQGEHAAVSVNGADELPQLSQQQQQQQQEADDPAKEARKVAKKLRQARELKARQVEGGDLLPEQAEKVARIEELAKQLEGLDVGEEGEVESERVGS